MKYANICNRESNSVNIGDYLQFMAIDNLYTEMGLKEDEIIRLKLSEVKTYMGERLILPINFFIEYFTSNGKMDISPDITPIFLAAVLHLVEKPFNADAFLDDSYNKEYFLKHAPIGCRDEETYTYFTKYNIPAYISGCLTATFPKIDMIAGENVVFVDVPKSLMPYIPDSILKEKILFSNQQFLFSDEELNDYKNMFRFVKEKYDFFKKEAKLVVTSRLHTALPCLAFGIPVILVKEKFDTRFSFIENYIPIYDEENYAIINWNPDVTLFEQLKHDLKLIAISRIKRLEISEAFKARCIKVKYFDSFETNAYHGEKFLAYATENWDKNSAEIKYALWGAKQSNVAYYENFIKLHYPNAKLSFLIDFNRKGENFKHPNEIANYKDVIILVCAVSAVEQAFELFEELDLPISNYAILTHEFILEDDLKCVK
ncbi:MAG: polysaccharide pyruvyl transferase family protein [Defluviitaleaceae bacterium]|nr:polysaccharide pyruvyl transferase family protein [Defluviitaleaceae bacterium]